MNVGIVGGAGFTAGELIRLLVHHPKVKLTSIVSQSQQGIPVTNIHRDLLGETDLIFQSEISSNVDLVFLCMGHGKSSEYLHHNPTLLSKNIIDLSTDFRANDNALNFIYGLPELNKKSIQVANKIANPGCFATAIQLSLLPLAQAHSIDSHVHIQGITGSTGAGQQALSTTHFSWRTNNVSIYKLFEHQHLTEIKESLGQLQPAFEQQLYFVPIRGNFTRGIFVSAYTQSDLGLIEILDLYQSFYQDHPFTIISENNISLKEVINTNKCHLQIRKHKDTIHITSVIDNLIKGASGQAIQNMNLMAGWDEETGLKLKSVAF